MASIKLTGMKDLMANLEKLDKRAQGQALRSAARKAAAPLVQLMKSYVPVDHGYLERSIKVSTKTKGRPNKERGGYTLYIGPSIYYSHFVEFGTQKMAEDPYVEPAWDADKDDLLNRLEQSMADILIKKGF